MRAATIFALALAVSCKPQIEERTSIVTSARVLAVRADPPEAAPVAGVALTALWADPSGGTDAPIDWAFCDERKPLAELGPVSTKCLARSGDNFEAVGSGQRVVTAIPQKACRRFGPEVPEAAKDEPPGRPVDPDETGGYFQPIRLAVASAVGDAFAIARVRLICGTVGASPEQLADLAMRNHPNANPALDLVSADGTLLTEAVPAPAMTASAGQRVSLRAEWAACAPDATSCTGAESYATYDIGSHAVVSRREGMRVSWFATAGDFASEHTGRDESDPATFTETAWTAPSERGRVTLWLVVRDDRGGAGWRSFAVDIR